MVAANGVRPMMGMGAPQIAMAPNGQMMMAANQIGNPVQGQNETILRVVPSKLKKFGRRRPVGLNPFQDSIL